MRRVLMLIGFVAVTLTPGAATAQVPATASLAECTLGLEQTRWLQTALDGWRWVLEVPLSRSAELPWMVLFDATCVWHLASPDGALEGLAPIDAELEFDGIRVDVRGAMHGGSIELPDGRELPPQPMAAGSLVTRGDESVPFFSLAMVDLWRDQAGAAEQPQLESFFLGVAIHEMVHTLQLQAAGVRVGEIRERHPLPDAVHDDMVQERFEGDAEYVALYEAERDGFYAAALAKSDADRRDLAREALDLSDARRERYFRDTDAAYAELEDLFLSMEGVAVWAHFELALYDPEIAFLPDAPDADPSALIDLARSEQGYWSQEEGFALFLLLEQLVPGWQPRVLGPELAPPFDLLRAALGERTTGPMAFR